MHALTHHEILGLVEPFARRQRHVDLAASDRMARRLAFRPFDREPSEAGAGPVVEALQLDNARPGTFRLTRVLTTVDGLQARLQADGADPGALLEQVEAVAPERQFPRHGGILCALSHQLVAGADPRLVLTEAALGVAGLAVRVKVSTVRGVPATVELRGPDAAAAALPEDLLAVLGWPWARLVRSEDGWRGQVDLRGRNEFARSADAERKLELLVRHLAQTLVEPPARFHERHLAARWTVVLRRLGPVLVGLGLIGASLGVSKLEIANNSLLRMMLFHLPPLLLMLFFCMREMPRFEIPPLPRRSPALTWQASPDGDAPRAPVGS